MATMRNAAAGTPLKSNIQENRSFTQRLKQDVLQNKYLYIMAIPGLLFYLIFHYAPMYGAIIAFKDYTPAGGIWGSPWVGLANFTEFFASIHFIRVLKNTVLLSLYSLIAGFPAPIILALLLNELRGTIFKRTVQTVTYIPHFVSVVVIAGMLVDFTMQSGIINDLLALFGFERTNLLMHSEYFRHIYVWSGIWQGVGWESIIYLAALSGIDQQLYEAARLDGAGRLRQTWHITLPGIIPTIMVLLIMRMGSIMSVGFEKVILLYNPATYETADIISSFVYRKGILDMGYSFSTAVGLFNSVINLALLYTSNLISRKVNGSGLW